MLYELKITKY